MLGGSKQSSYRGVFLLKVMARAQPSLWSTSPSTLVHTPGDSPPVVLTEARHRRGVGEDTRDKGRAEDLRGRSREEAVLQLLIATLAVTLQVSAFLLLQL